MAFTERYGSPRTRIIDLVAAWKIPFRNVDEGDKFVIFTDSAMDPLVWESALSALKDRGADPIVCLWPRLRYHNDDPPATAVEAAKEADVVMALATTALNSGTPALRAIRKQGITPIWLMEEMTVEILTQGGGSVTIEEVEEIADLQRRVGEIYDNGKKIRVLSAHGTDVLADIGDYPPNALAKRWGRVPFVRTEEGRFLSGTWPYGEVHVEPLPGTAEGTLVWDSTGHHPPGLWRDHVALTIKKGGVTDIQGGAEAREVEWYLQTHGDENSYLLGGEISLGTNKKCPPHTGQMRSEKKRYGAMHFGIGHGADRGIVNSKLRMEGIISQVTIVVDDDIVVCQDGQILV